MGELPLAEIAAEVTGTTESPWLGPGFCAGVDIVGDASPDFVVGAWAATVGRDEDKAGAVYLFAGPIDGSRTVDSAAVTIRGVDGNYGFGQTVACLDDFDGDGVADIVASELANAPRSSTYVFRGPFFGERSSSDADLHLSLDGLRGSAHMQAWSVGDPSGDGLTDIAIGAPTAPSGSVVFLAHSPLEGEYSLDCLDTRLIGADRGEFGSAVTRTGDVDGDGIHDLLVGDPQLSSTDAPMRGEAYVFSGPLSGIVDHADATFIVRGDTADQAGASVAGLGDLDRDGLADIAVGAYGGESEPGAYLFADLMAGETGLRQARARLISGDDSEYCLAGHQVAGAGDIDGDGELDVLVSDPWGELGGLGSGTTYVVFGPFSGTVRLDGSASLKLVGQVGTESGIHIEGGFDLDEDEIPDPMIFGYANETEPATLFVAPGEMLRVRRP